MKLIKYLTRKLLHCVIFFLITCPVIVFSTEARLCLAAFQSRNTERGLEIRYISPYAKEINTKKDEVIVLGVAYRLYKNREQAITAVTFASPKKDYTVVYVLSEIEKSQEIITLKE